ncbi:hypothetical protein ACJX0J_007901 [Zea mays]
MPYVEENIDLLAVGEDEVSSKNWYCGIFGPHFVHAAFYAMNPVLCIIFFVKAFIWYLLYRNLHEITCIILHEITKVHFIILHEINIWELKEYIHTFLLCASELSINWSLHRFHAKNIVLGGGLGGLEEGHYASYIKMMALKFMTDEDVAVFNGMKEDVLDAAVAFYEFPYLREDMLHLTDIILFLVCAYDTNLKQVLIVVSPSKYNTVKLDNL